MTIRSKMLALAAMLPLAALASPVAAHNQGAKSTASTMTAAAAAPITRAEVEAAQQAWGNALVAISTEYERNGQAAAKRLAEQVIDSAYGYDMGPVLFKPTLAAAPQTFRTERDGALAYFVGGNANYANDKGFALMGWRDVDFTNAGILTNGNTATSLGNVTFTDSKGNKTTVDKTFGYVRGADGKLRIVLHHSSLPYKAS